MKKLFKILTMLSLAMLLATAAHATNGDNMIAIGPIARAMGGVGIAQPLDAISAVFANPAAMCFGRYCPASEMNFAGTIFMPDVEAKITNSSGVIQVESEENVYAIPAIGFSVPIGSGVSRWRFGLAAYGVSGLGVDYRGTALDNPGYFPGPFPPGFPPPPFPLVSGEYTQLQIMKFAPSIAFLATPRLSLGLAVHVDYATLDLRSGGSTGYSFGVQPGIIFKPTTNLSIGLTYTSAQSVDHDNVADFNLDGVSDTLELEAPQQAGIGVAYEFVNAGVLLEANVKWINWSDAEGYSDFDWNDQWVIAVGAQFEPVSNLFLRIGYNYGENPVNEHNGFSGFTTVQGYTMPTYYYETFRMIGFPAIVEHHLTGGIGYQVTDKFSLDLGFMYAFENTISETGFDFNGPTILESSLSETSVEFGLTWRF